MERGEVRWYTFAPPNKRRPVLILTRTAAIPFLEKVVVAGITTRIHGLLSEVLLDEADGMHNRCVISLDNLATVDTSRLVTDGAHITTLDDETMMLVREALLYAVGS